LVRDRDWGLNVWGRRRHSLAIGKDSLAEECDGLGGLWALSGLRIQAKCDARPPASRISAPWRSSSLRLELKAAGGGFARGWSPRPQGQAQRHRGGRAGQPRLVLSRIGAARPPGAAVGLAAAANRRRRRAMVASSFSGAPRASVPAPRVWHTAGAMLPEGGLGHGDARCRGDADRRPAAWGSWGVSQPVKAGPASGRCRGDVARRAIDLGGSRSQAQPSRRHWIGGAALTRCLQGSRVRSDRRDSRRCSQAPCCATMLLPVFDHQKAPVPWCIWLHSG